MVVGGGKWMENECYFVAKSGKVVVWPGDPRKSLEAGMKRSYSKRIGISDSEFWARRKPSNGYDLIGYPDEHGNMISVDSAHKIGLDVPKPIYPGPGDTGESFTSNPPPAPTLTPEELLALQRRRKDSLERSPFVGSRSGRTGHGVQEIKVGDSVFLRSTGETRFHPAEWTTNPVEHSRRNLDSIRAARVNDPCFRNVDLSDPKDLAKAREIADSLAKVNDSGLYRVWTTNGRVKQLYENNLKVIRTPHQPPSRRNNGVDSLKESRARSRQASAAL